MLRYCNINFAEGGDAKSMRVDHQPLDQWSMIFQLQNVPHKRFELEHRYEWLFLGDMLVLKLHNRSTQRLIAASIEKSVKVVINDLVHAEEDQHRWIAHGLPMWMPRRDYILVTNTQTRFAPCSWLDIYHYDFLFNRTKAYYAGFPFTGNSWYYAGKENYRAPLAKEGARTKVFISPSRLYLDYQRTYFRKRLFELTARYAALGYRSGPGRVRNGVLDKTPSGTYLASTTDDPLINFENLGWKYDPMTGRTIVSLEALDRWQGARWHGYSPIHNRYYDDTFISIYAETLEHGIAIVLTEKTYEPLIKGHFILPFSTPRFIATVRSQGYLLPEFIDYSYDDIEDDERRFTRYSSEVKRLMAIPILRWRKFWRQNLELLHHNQRTFYLRDYERLPFLLAYEHRPYRSTGRHA